MLPIRMRSWGPLVAACAALSNLACSSGADLPQTVTPENQFVLEGLHYTLHADSTTHWRISAVKGTGSLRHTTLQEITAELFRDGNEKAVATGKAPAGDFQVKTNALVLQKLRFETDAPAVLTATQATIEAGPAPIRAAGPIVYTSRGLSLTATRAELSHDTQRLTLTGPVTGTFFPTPRALP